MSESVRQGLPAIHADIALRPSAEQLLVIRKAAELIGWTVTDYVLSTALDRAERDLYEAAARDIGPSPETDPTGPITAVLLALT